MNTEATYYKIYIHHKGKKIEAQYPSHRYVRVETLLEALELPSDTVLILEFPQVEMKAYTGKDVLPNVDSILCRTAFGATRNVFNSTGSHLCGEAS